ncbi:copper resistance D family protein [Actinophytocola oryzae]|uniref:Putative copper resistance protein D n=1 Tax=Actinophytocola oryzae TaxID=502181 RepID=A0A4R7VML6_9PSEU|nr:CopD family protein [Actinophytocola oryzae]TDV50863.1 putative copper resistance protein D [Actinophytocola oryzae]
MTQIRTTAFNRLPLVAAAVGTALAAVVVGLVLTPVAEIPGVPGPDAVVRYGLPIARVLFDLSAVATVGLNLLPFLVGLGRPKVAAPVLAGARRAAAFSALALAVTAVVALVLQTAEVHPDQDRSGISPDAVADYVVTVSAGKALVFVAGVALISFVLSIWAVRAGDAVPAELRAAVALFALLPLPVTGHATDFRWQDYAMISMELHVLGAAVWTGGLGAVVVVLATNRTLLSTALPKFSTLATVCLCVVAATGLFNAVVELGSVPGKNVFDTLFGTGYGTLVILKLVCYGLLAVFGANIRWRLMPGIVRHQRTALIGWATVELAVMGAAFGFAVVLTRTPVS